MDRTSSRTLVLLLAAVMAFPVAAASTKVTDPDIPRELPSHDPVSVSWTDPAQFTEIRTSLNRRESERGNWVVDLAEYLQQQAGKRLQPGQRMDITITNVKLAGEYEPGRGIQMNDVRVVKDIYPPRMELQYKLLDADGSILAEGDDKLVDSAFLMGSNPLSSDRLRYEKRMIDDWLRGVFKSTAS